MRKSFRLSKTVASLALIVCMSAIGAGAAFAASYTASWTQLNTLTDYPSSPGPRVWTNIVYNPLTSKLNLFGGATSLYFWDVWEYDVPSGVWRAQELPDNNCPGFFGFSGPDGRDSHTVAFDPYNNLIWTVGGSGYKCANNTSLVGFNKHTVTSSPNDTTMVDTSLSASLPVDFYKDWSVIANTQMAYVTGYNPVSRALILATPISGLTAGTSYELRVYTDSTTWYYSPVTRAWRSLDGPHWGYTGPNPNRLWGRLSPAFEYSPVARAMVMFGGSVNGVATNETWKLDLTDRSNPAHPAAWVQMSANDATSTSLPPARNEISTAMVYDTRNDVFILFGGRCTGSLCTAVAAADTWAYKLSTNTWKKMNPPVSPPGRMGHQMYFDSDNGVVVMFGGTNDDYYLNVTPESGYLSDLWVYDYSANTWTQVPRPAIAPGGRRSGSLAYDPTSKAAILYGGMKFSYVADPELWKLVLTPQAPANQPPTASFSMTPASGDTNTTFSFSGTASTDTDGTISNYSWDFGDGTTASGVSATHRYATASTYTVRLTVTDNAGATGTVTKNLVVNAANVAPTASIQPSSTNGDTSTAFSFSGAGSSDSDGSIATYAWSFGDGSSASGVSASHRYTTAGVYTVRLTVTDDRGAQGTASVVIAVSSVNQPPIAAISASPTNGSTATLFSFSSAGSSDADGSIVNYVWDFGDGASGSGATTTHRFAAGSYTVHLTVTDDRGATASAATNVAVTVVNQLPAAMISVNPGSGTTETVFTFNSAGSSDTDGSIASYAWDFGDGITATGATASHRYSGAGAYAVTLTVTDNLGGASTATASVTVAGANQAPVAVIQTTPSSGDSSTTFTFNGGTSGDPDGSIATYAWDFGDGSTASGATVSHRFTSAGNYTVRLTVTDDRGAEGTTTSAVIVSTVIVTGNPGNGGSGGGGAMSWLALLLMAPVLLRRERMAQLRTRIQNTV